VEAAAPLTNARGCVMSDTFWVSLFTFFTLIAKAVLDEWRGRRQEEHNRKLAIEMHANTVATIQGTQETLASAVNAQKAATTAAARTAVIEEKADTIKETANKIEERLNGGDGGLGARVAKNEARLESLEKGQRSHDEAIGAVARSVDQLVMSFASFTNEVKKAIAVPPAEIRGEAGGKA
jgi:hypothetical protein